MRWNKKEKNGRWKGVEAGYASIHQWLKRNFGNPSNCDFCGTDGCKEKDGRWSIHWALKKGYQHGHDRNSYLGLCRTCHGKYDWNEQKTQNMIIAAKRGLGIKSPVKSRIALERARDGRGCFLALQKK